MFNVELGRVELHLKHGRPILTATRSPAALAAHPLQTNNGMGYTAVSLPRLEVQGTIATFMHSSENVVCMASSARSMG